MYTIKFDANIENSTVQSPQEYKELCKVKSARFVDKWGQATFYHLCLS